MSTPVTPPRTVLAILVLLWVVEAYLTRAGYLMPVPPMLF